VSIFIYCSFQTFSVSTRQKTNFYKLAEGLNICASKEVQNKSSGLDGAAASIEDCGSSDSSANLDLDLATLFSFKKEKSVSLSQKRKLFTLGAF
jgi:hypothetical protein